MKKFLLTTAIIMTLLTTACGNTSKEEVTEVTTEVENTINVTETEETSEEVNCMYTEIEFLAIKHDMMATIYDGWVEFIEEGFSEEVLTNIIKVVDDLEYNPALECGIDVDAFERDMIDVFVDGGMISEEHRNLTVDELREIGYDWI